MGGSLQPVFDITISVSIVLIALQPYINIHAFITFVFFPYIGATSTLSVV